MSSIVALPQIISWRCSGQYRTALNELSTMRYNNPNNLWVFTEKAQCLFLLQDFRTLLDLLIESRSSLTKNSKEEALVELLYGFARAHTELALPEANIKAQYIYDAWLKNREVDIMDDLDISLLCFSHMISNLNFQFSSCDNDPEEDFPSHKKLETLRVSLLGRKDTNNLAMVLLADEKSSMASERVSKITEVLNILPEDATEMRTHLDILLTKALYATDNVQSALQTLTEAQRLSLSTSNQERLNWAQFYLIKLGNCPPTEALYSAKMLLCRFQDQGDYYGSLMCSMSICLFAAACDQDEEYQNFIQKTLLESNDTNLPTLENITQNADRAPSNGDWVYSSLDFWLQYILHCLKEDMSSRIRIGVAISCCNKFFQRHSQSTITQIKYTISDSLAECYEDLGDMHQVIHWRGRGKNIAYESDDTEMQEEAKYKMTIALSDKAVKPLIDPHGFERPAWDQACREDLEKGWEQARVKMQHLFQYSFAVELLRRELEDEVRTKKAPCGVFWAPRVEEALRSLPSDIRRTKALHYSYHMAHAMFEAGQYQKSISAFASLASEAMAFGNTRTESMSYFTQARAYLHLFSDTKDPMNWEESRKVIEKCQQESQKRREIDVVALCHIIQAVLWNVKEPREPKSLAKVLNHISDAAALWDEERSYVKAISSLHLDDLMSKYLLRGRNEKSPYAILGLAIDICYEIEDFRGAWRWVEYAKARAFVDDLQIGDTQMGSSLKDSFSKPPSLPIIDESVIFVHWAFVGEKVYLLVDQSNTQDGPIMRKLDIKVSEIESWYEDLVATKEDLSDNESADEILSEISALCLNLVDPMFEGKLMVLSPTGVLFKIPLHAIPLWPDGRTLLDFHPIVYAHSISVLNECHQRSFRADESKESLTITFFGNPTENTPAGEISVRKLSSKYGGDVYIGENATSGSFTSACAISRAIHFHGHVVSADHPLNNAMLFHGPKELRVREVFNLDLQKTRPLVVLIGCGSGKEQLYYGDEPLGFVSAFIHAGSPAVLGTMWPINDHSGLQFSEVFYSDMNNPTKNPALLPDLDIARRLRAAALKIKANPATAAPYFWAGFVLYGYWMSLA